MCVHCIPAHFFKLSSPSWHVYKVTIYPALFCSLSELGLTHIPSKLLQQLPNLEDLDLSLNKLTAIENEGALPQVKKLSFAGNQLSSTDGLTAFPNLENVNVTDNPTLEVIVFIFVCV